MNQCEGIRDDMPCDQEAHGVMDTHGCDVRHLCVGCKIMLEMILNQMYGVGVDMECYICGILYPQESWSTWTRYVQQ